MAKDTTNNLSETAGELKNKGQSLDVANIDIAIDMLTTYMDVDEVSSLLSALKTLRTEPLNEDFQLKVVTAFNALGVSQGAVLTYAPALNIFISDDPFGD